MRRSKGAFYTRYLPLLAGINQETAMLTPFPATPDMQEPPVIARDDVQGE